MAEKKRATITTVFSGEGAASTFWNVSIFQEKCPDDTGTEIMSINSLASGTPGTITQNGSTMGLVDGDAYWDLIESYYKQFGVDTDGNLSQKIYVQTTPEDLLYSVNLNRGTYEDGGIQEVEQEEVIPISFNEYAVTLYKISTVISTDWDGYVYNERGETAEHPNVEFNSERNTLDISAEVVGALRVKYTTLAHVYTVTIPPKLTTEIDRNTGKLINVEDQFFSVFMVFWNDEHDQPRVTQYTIDDCDATKAYSYGFSGQVCVQNTSTSILAAKGRITSPEYAGAEPPTYTTDASGENILNDENVPFCDDVPNEEEYTVMYVAYDYCTGEEITGATFIVDGEQVNDPEAHTIAKGTHTIKVIADGYKDTDADDLTDNDSFEV